MITDPKILEDAAVESGFTLTELARQGVLGRIRLILELAETTQAQSLTFQNSNHP